MQQCTIRFSPFWKDLHNTPNAAKLSRRSEEYAGNSLRAVVTITSHTRLSEAWCLVHVIEREMSDHHGEIK